MNIADKPLIFVRFARVTYTVVTLSGDKKCSQRRAKAPCPSVPRQPMPNRKENTVLEAYRQHEAERAAQGIPAQAADRGTGRRADRAAQGAARRRGTVPPHAAVGARAAGRGRGRLREGRAFSPPSPGETRVPADLPRRRRETARQHARRLQHRDRSSACSRTTNSARLPPRNSSTRCWCSSLPRRGGRPTRATPTPAA
jgi:hypothetical protein